MCLRMNESLEAPSMLFSNIPKRVMPRSRKEQTALQRFSRVPHRLTQIQFFTRSFYHRISQKGRFAPTPNTPKQVWKVWKVKQVWKVYFLNLLNLSTFALVQCIQWSKNKTSSPPHFAQCGSAYPLAYRGTRHFCLQARERLSSTSKFNFQRSNRPLRTSHAQRIIKPIRPFVYI